MNWLNPLVIGCHFSKLYINHSDSVFSLTKEIKNKNLDEMGHVHFLLDEMGLDKMGLDEMGLDEMG